MSAPTSSYTVFWLYKANPAWRAQPEQTRAQARSEFVNALESHGQHVSIRGVYSSVGLSANADLIIWAVADNADALQNLAIEINHTKLGHLLEMREIYLGVASMSQYDPEHGPAFLKGIPPKKFLSVYPFTKTPEWYLLPFDTRRDLMIEHGKMGNEFPSILTNTVSSFGIADQEFIVALEDDDPDVLIKMVQRLRAAEVRIYTQVDTPIYLGRLKEPDKALRDLG